MVIAVRTIGKGGTDAGYGNAILRVESAPVTDNGADSYFYKLNVFLYQERCRF